MRSLPEVTKDESDKTDKWYTPPMCATAKIKSERQRKAKDAKQGQTNSGNESIRAGT